MKRNPGRIKRTMNNFPSGRGKQKQNKYWSSYYNIQDIKCDSVADVDSILNLVHLNICGDKM